MGKRRPLPDSEEMQERRGYRRSTIWMGVAVVVLLAVVAVLLLI